MVSDNIGIVTVWADSGAGFVSQAYYNALKSNFNVKIYSRGSYTYDNNLPIWNFGDVTIDKSIDNPTSINKNIFVKWILDNKISLILFNEQRFWKPILWAKELGVKCVSYIDYYTAETINFFDLYDGLICNTQRHFSVFQNFKNTIYIPWGTDSNLFGLNRNYTKIDQVSFLHSAGLSGPNDRKGTKNLIIAFANTIGKAILYIDSQLPLTFYDNEIQDIVLKDSRIVFRNVTTVAPHNYKDAHVYVYPTRLEGIGLTIAEALMSGMPVITTNNPPMNEIVIDNYNGRLINVDSYVSRYDGYYWPEAVINIKSLTSLIQFYIDNPSVIISHSTNAIDKSLKELNWEDNFQNITSFISKTILANPANLDPYLIDKIHKYDKVNNPNGIDLFFSGLKKIIKKSVS